nr:hypothetical protein GCM10020092_018750 [Actinoplanes digitatis]
MHVALGLLGSEGVQRLLEAQHVQRGDAQDLGLAALEQGRAVHPGQDADLGAQRPDVARPAAVHADLVAEHAVAHLGLGDRAERGADLLLAALELRADGLDDLGLDAVQGLLAVRLLDDLQRLDELALGGLGDGGVDVVLVVQEDRELLHGLRGDLGQLALRAAELADGRLGGLEAAGDDLLGRLRRTGRDQSQRVRGGLGLDHHDRDLTVGQRATGDDHVEGGAGQLVEGGEVDPLALDVRDAGRADRAAERQARELGRHRGAVHGDDIVGVLRVEREDGLDDLDLVAQALGERRAQRPVDQAAGEDRVLAGAALAAEERAGDAADGVHPLLDVDRQREEVEVVLRRLA